MSEISSFTVKAVKEVRKMRTEELKKRIVQKIPVFLRKYLQTVVRRAR
ncbi:MAG TPA: hypothetical protein VKU79_06565 [Thermoplasmataceae archaeon]|nr:hypothetical protein [Thermoplasmataceae archaeon]